MDATLAHITATARSSTASPGSIGRERRVVGQALSYWHEVRAHRALPLLDEIAFDADPILAGKLFLLDVREGVEGCRFTYEGGCLSEAFHCADAQGARLHEALPSDVADHLTDMVRAVVDFRKPLADAATLPRVRGGGLLKHRMVVMPVSCDGTRVSHVLGAYSYKVD